MSSSKSKLRIGSADDADIVIKQATVSRYHCELHWNSGAWELHDIGSTNGTFVDGVRITEVKRLAPKNVVTLGRGIPLEIPSPPKTASAKAEAAIRATTTEIIAAPIAAQPKSGYRAQPESSHTKWLYVFGTVALMSLIGVMSLFIVNSGSRQVVGDMGNVQQANPEVPGDKVLSKPLENAPIASSTPSASGSKAEELKSKLAPAPELVQCDPAFWAVIVESSDGKNQKLLGTAVAIGPNRLVTLASIVQAVEAVKSTYPQLIIAQPANPPRRIVPVKTEVHPNNQAALAKFQDFEKRFAEKINSVNELKEPSLEESLEWSGQLETIMAEIAKSDLASLTIQETLEKFLPIGKDAISDQATNCIVRGFPMFVPSPDIQANLSMFYLDMPANYKMDTRLKQPAPLVEASDFAGLPMISMVCINPKSELVGLCVREEPNQDVAAPKRGQITRVEAFW